jgi:hypothetical protein
MRLVPGIFGIEVFIIVGQGQLLQQSGGGT